jgi:hypothetical protein
LASGCEREFVPEFGPVATFAGLLMAEWDDADGLLTELLPTAEVTALATFVTDGAAFVAVTAGGPMIPSPLRSWCSVVSSDCRTALEPDTDPNRFET